MGNAAGVESSSSSSGGGASATVVPPRAINTTATLSPRDVDTLREKYEGSSVDNNIEIMWFFIVSEFVCYGSQTWSLLAKTIYDCRPYVCLFSVVTSEEIHLLFERFCILGPDENGLLSRRVFQKPPYSTDPFCRQV